MSFLDGLNFYGESTLDEQIVRNVVHFLREGFLQIGGFYNITKGKLNARGEDISILTPITGGGVTNYTLYKGIKHDWVWESNINLKYGGGSQPIQPSGIYVNNVFYPTGTNVNGGQFIINFSQGRVEFANALNRGDRVQGDYSVRTVNVYRTDEPEYRSFVGNWYKGPSATGTIDLNAKAYLPCVGVRIIGYKTARGYEIGSRAKVTQCDLEFNVFANSAYECNKILDTLYMMEDKAITLYNTNSGLYPLNSRGQLINPNATYANNVINFPYRTGHFMQNARIVKNENILLPLYFGNMRIGLELVTNPF